MIVSAGTSPRKQLSAPPPPPPQWRRAGWLFMLRVRRAWEGWVIAPLKSALDCRSSSGIKQKPESLFVTSVTFLSQFLSLGEKLGYPARIAERPTPIHSNHAMPSCSVPCSKGRLKSCVLFMCGLLTSRDCCQVL